MSALDPKALEALKNNQRQLDMDGVEVGVSRQAPDELIAAYEATPPKGQAEAVAWQTGGTVAFTPDGVTYSQPSSDDTLDKVASIRDAYAKLKADALDQMELWAAQGATAEVSQFSSEAERHRAALLACNRIISLLETALASPAPAGRGVEGKRHPLEAYADSYAQMGRDPKGDGRVDCRSVEIDIRQNMIPATTAAPIPEGK